MRRSLVFVQLVGEVAADAVEDGGGGGEVGFGQACERGGTDFGGGGFDLVDDGEAVAGDGDGLGAAVSGLAAALNEAGGFQGVEQADDGGAVENERRGEVLLPHRGGGAGEVDERQPSGLGEPERLQAAIDRPAPLAGGAGDEGGEGGADRRGHLGVPVLDGVSMYGTSCIWASVR